jgi:hypothetical protein
MDYASSELRGRDRNGSILIEVREAVGIVVEESGRMPNPTARFKVFKPLKIIR